MRTCAPSAGASFPGAPAAAGLLALAAALGACHRQSPAEAGASAPAASAATQALAKVDDYTACYAQLIGNGGLADTARGYATADLPHQPVTAGLSLDTGSLDSGLAVLKRAWAQPGSLPGIDPRADLLIGALEPLVDHLKALDDYYLARAYREDRLARGRREDAPLRAEFARALAALQGLDAALGAEQERLNAQGILRAQARGDALTLATRQALQQAGQLVALFREDASLHDPAVLARADGLVPALEARLAEQRRLSAAEKKPPPPGSTGDDLAGYDMAARELTRMIGDYRELRQDPQPASRDDVAREYVGALLDARNVGRFNHP